MNKRTETSIEDREVVVKLTLEGKSLKEISKVIGRSRSTIQGIVRKFKDYGITSNKQGRGRKPILNETQKRNIMLEILRDPNQSVPKLTSEIANKIGRSVSCETVRRVVRTVSYQAQRSSYFLGLCYQGLDVGVYPSINEQMNQENPPTVDDEQMEGEADFSNKKVRRRKKQLYQNIRKQMEFYFSDANLTKDRFLGKLMMENPCIDIAIFMSFNRIRALTTDPRDIASALRASDLLSVTEDGTKVFRITPVTQKENIDDCTIYVEQLPPDAQHDWLKEVFSAYGNVSYVSIPKYRNGKIKGFAFVEFETPEEANKTLEAFGAMGCRLSPQMAPDTLCSIQTFEPEEEKTETTPAAEELVTVTLDEDPDDMSKKKKKNKKVKLQTNDEDSSVDDSEDNQQIESKKRKKSDGNETEGSGDDQPTKKKKKSNGVELMEKEQQLAEENSFKEEQSKGMNIQPEKKKRKRKSEDVDDKSADEESESVEIQVGKKKCKQGEESIELVEENKEIVSDDLERKKQKRKHEVTEEIEEAVEEDEKQPEAENEGEVEDTGEEEMTGEVVEGEGKKRRRRKKQKKKKSDVETSRLKILSKKEWKRLRNKYLDLQKVKMKCLKQYMVRNRWGKSTPARSQQSSSSMQEREEANVEKQQETAKQPEPESKPRITFTPGVIVHTIMEQPVMDVRKFKADVRALSEVEYVDIMMGSNEAFIRCATTTAAENLLSNAPWQQTELLKGDDEKKYWDRIFEERQEKFSNKVRVKQRGRDKVLRRAERELGKHIRFDD